MYKLSKAIEILMNTSEDYLSLTLAKLPLASSPDVMWQTAVKPFFGDRPSHMDIIPYLK